MSIKSLSLTGPDSGVVKLDLTISFSAIREGTSAILREIRPNWSETDIEMQEFTEGLTNRLYGFRVRADDTDTIMVRVNGNHTELFIDREAECHHLKLLSEAGFASQLYAIFNNGYAYQYLSGETLDTDSVREPEVALLIANKMAQLHMLPLKRECDTKAKPILFTELKRYVNLVPDAIQDAEMQERFVKGIPAKSLLKEHLDELERVLSEARSPVVFCHNDLLLKNILYDAKMNRVSFIDYEYSGCNFQAFDIANHFCEYAGMTDIDFSLYPDETYQLKWLRNYLAAYNDSDDISDGEVRTLYVQVCKFALSSLFLWSLWGLVQSVHSTVDYDYLGFGIKKMQEYLRRREEFLYMS